MLLYDRRRIRLLGRSRDVLTGAPLPIAWYDFPFPISPLRGMDAMDLRVCLSMPRAGIADYLGVDSGNCQQAYHKIEEARRDRGPERA